MARLTEIDVDPDVLESALGGSEGAQAAIYAAVAPATFGLVRRLVSGRAMLRTFFRSP